MTTTSESAAEPSESAARTSLERLLDTKPKRPGPLHRTAAIWKDEYDTLVNWPRGARHLLARGTAYLIVNTIALLIVAGFLPGIEIGGGFPANVLSALAAHPRRGRHHVRRPAHRLPGDPAAHRGDGAS